jgi:gas vesicle protein
MEWIRTHPYATALALAGLFIIAGAIVVGSRTPVAPTASSAAWSGTVPLSAYQQSNVQTVQPQAIAAEVIQNTSPVNLTLPVASASTPTSAPISISSSDSFDFAALMAKISAPSSGTASASANSNSASQVLSQAYAYIPQGLVATNALAPKPLTADQQSLYDYGNEVGSTIQSFEEENQNEAQTLKNQIEDRSDPTKATAVVELGQNLAAVGARMQSMDDVPDSVASFHASLAQSYQNIGAKLQLVPKAQSDSDYVKAIEAYDSAADGFTRNYAALANYFSLKGVTFAPGDPGSVFSFTDAQGL